MNAECLYLNIENTSKIILACYKKMAILEMKGLDTSLEYEKTLKSMELLSSLEDSYYAMLSSDKILEEKFYAYIGWKFDNRKLKNYATGYYRLFHEFPDEELINVRMFTKLSTLKSIEVIDENETRIRNMGEIVAYLFERKNVMFLDILDDDIDNPDYAPIRKTLIKAKYDQAFMLKKSNVTCEVDQEDIECVGIGNDLFDVETLGMKLSKLNDKSIEANYRSVILNLAYIKSCLLQVHPFLVFELISKFENKKEKGEVNDTPGYQLFMKTLEEIVPLRDRYLITDNTLKRKI